MFKQKIESLLKKAIKEIGFILPTDPLLSIPEKSQFGDYSSNISLQLSKQKHQNRYQNPQEIASAIIEKLGHPNFLETIEIAGPGFLNFFIKDEELVREIREVRDVGEEDHEPSAISHQRIIVEYCDPNTHKMLHIGHLLQLTLGETLARLYEYQGHEVFRANYGSDIGLTVAKCLWGIGKLQEEYKKAQGGSLREKAEFLGKTYAYAHGEYEKSLEVKEEIDHITNKLYQRAPEVLDLWHETKDWSLGYFETIYSIFGTLFDRRINESEIDQEGKRIVEENIGPVFVHDAGAVIFPGEKYGLHTRVFLNSKGNPTYEGKEVGLAQKYQEIFLFDKLDIFSHKEQDDYFKVVIKANELLFPQLKGKINHISYGEVRLPSGKMSSRHGNIVAAEDILEEVKSKIKEISPGLENLSIQKLAVGAIKFAFLKYSVSSDIIYDIEESISIHGDTGPYVMYVYARINSLLKKAKLGNRAQPSLIASAGKQANRASLRQGYGLQANSESEAEELEDDAQEEKIAQGDKESEESKESKESEVKTNLTRLTQAKSLDSSDSANLEPVEREVLRQLEYFEFIAQKAGNNFQPNELVKYLLNLCKAFNGFYETQTIIGSKQEQFRLLLATRVAETIKLGMYLLGIETVDKM